MFDFMKSPLTKITKHNSVDPGFSASPSTNPFDSDTESDSNQTLNPAKRTSSEPNLTTPNLKAKLFDKDGGNGASSASSSYSRTSAQRNLYKNDFRDTGGLENQSVQELEDYAVYKAEETTKTVNGCLKIAENIREDATNTLVTLHKQGEQITRTHMVAADIDQDLSRGEKLLGSLGGMFSKTWKPKKTRAIRGPVISRDDSFKRRSNHLEQREKLGLAPVPKERSNSRQPLAEPTNAIQKVEVEKAKQDDALSDLSNILGELKVMAMDMGTEIQGHNKALEHVGEDVDEINFRIKGANQRGHRLLGK
ncbi:SNAP25 homologous protein SNAP33-like [Telopea speciosissima]|uniref:SNAP25 homologous protein SNAP33-like n=1 Tax=Telopea speciosissima TaxID=54955 RepID=UPI001CC629DF|nr:SNAP25 homologous protein SNAP33-like [Telopea speciosissima]